MLQKKRLCLLEAEKYKVDEAIKVLLNQIEGDWRWGFLFTKLKNGIRWWQGRAFLMWTRALVPVILNEVAGYYNDLTEKVTKDDPDILVPKYYVDTGEKVYFSIGIFQYGLAAYDLYLKTSEAAYEKKFISCAEWALDNQQKTVVGWRSLLKIQSIRILQWRRAKEYHCW